MRTIAEYVGLFEHQAGRRLSLTGRQFVGGLAGYNNGGQISGSAVSGTVIGTYSAGGLIGYNADGAISGSRASASVTGTSPSAGCSANRAERTADRRQLRDGERDRQ